MGVDEPTDVLAFPLEDDAVGAGRWPDNGPNGPSGHRDDGGEPPLLLGDVVVCPQVAATNAPTHAGHVRRRARAARGARHPARARHGSRRSG